MTKKIIIMMLITIITIQGLLLTACKDKAHPVKEPNNASVTDEQAGEQANNTSSTDEQDSKQVDEQEEQTPPPPPNPYPDGIVYHRPEADYLIETWGTYNDRFEKPENIEVTDEMLYRYHDYALIWPEFVNRMNIKEKEFLDYRELVEGMNDRYMYMDDEFVGNLEHTRRVYGEDEYSPYQAALKAYREDPERYEKLWGHLLYKDIITDDYEITACWNEKRRMLDVSIYGKKWEINTLKPDDPMYSKSKLYRADEGLAKFNIDEKMEEDLIYILSHVLNRRETRLVIMKLREIEKAVNEVLDKQGVVFIPYSDLEGLTWKEKAMIRGMKPYLYHMYFDTGISVSFWTSRYFLYLDVCRWQDIDSFKKHAKAYCTSDGIAWEEQISSKLLRELNLDIKK